MKKGIKYILTIILILITIAVSTCTIITPKSFASLGANAKSETVPGTGYDPAPNDTPQTDIGDSTPQQTDYNEYIDLYRNTYISGHVYVDAGQSSINYNGLRPAKNIGVQLINPNDGSVAKSVRTDDNGVYEFTSNDAIGEFKLKFSLGDTSFLTDESNSDEVLKYNGHDYIITQLPDGTYTYSTVEREIIRSGKGCEQVILLIDDSPSARNTIVKVKR